MSAKHKTPKKVRVSITAPPPLWAMAEKLAKERGVTMDQFFESLIAEELQRIEEGHPTDLYSPELVRELKKLGVISPPRKKASREG